MFFERLTCVHGSARVGMVLVAFLTASLLHGQSTDEEPIWDYSGDLGERAVENAAVLAMRETTSLRVDPALLASIRADLEQIYEFDGGLAAAPARPHVQPGAVLARVTDEVDQQLAAGEYAPWNALQGDWGSGTARRISTRSKIWLFSFEEPLNPSVLIARIKAQWNGLRFAEPNAVMGDGPDVERSAKLRWYAFILRWGDCPSGCIEEKRRLVAIENGAVIELDREAAQALLEVKKVSYAEEIAAAVGDRMQLRGTATLASKKDPSVAIEGELQWAIDTGNGRASVGCTYPVYNAQALDATFYVEVVHPLSGAVWAFPQRTRLLQRPTVSGDRYADYWLGHPLGWLNDRHYPWVWTPDHEWWWISEPASAVDGWWTYDLKMGWIYVSFSNDGEYPFLFVDGRWCYYVRGSRMPRDFYDYRTKTWFSVE